MIKNKSEENALKSVWLGLVHLTGDPENSILDGCIGVYTNATAKVNNLKDFEDAVKKAAEDFDLHLEEIDWAMPILKRLKTYDIENDIYENALDTAETGVSNFSTFYGYLAIDESDDTSSADGKDGHRPEGKINN